MNLEMTISVALDSPKDYPDVLAVFLSAAWFTFRPNGEIEPRDHEGNVLGRYLVSGVEFDGETQNHIS